MTNISINTTDFKALQPYSLRIGFKIIDYVFLLVTVTYYNKKKKVFVFVKVRLCCLAE